MYGEVAYPYVALARFNSVDQAVLSWLTEKGKLPKDVLLRAELFDKKRYAELVDSAVLAALNGDELPEFVAKPLPNAFTMYVAANHDYKNGAHPLTMLEGDYHRFATLWRIASEIGVNQRLMYPLWQRVIAEIEPELAVAIEEEKNAVSYGYTRGRAAYILQDTVVNDEAAHEAYRDEAARKRLSRGIGRRCLLPLGYLLADNHPELFEELDAERHR